MFEEIEDLCKAASIKDEEYTKMGYKFTGQKSKKKLYHQQILTIFKLTLQKAKPIIVSYQT